MLEQNLAMNLSSVWIKLYLLSEKQNKRMIRKSQSCIFIL